MKGNKNDKYTKIQYIYHLTSIILTNMSSNFPKETYKIIIVGDGNVGKTSIIQKLATDKFDTEYHPTMGVEITNVPFTTENKEVILNIWDCAGSERYKGLCEGYYMRAKAAMIVFDITNKQSFESIEMYTRNIFRLCGKIPVIIVGTKYDLRTVSDIEFYSDVRFIHSSLLYTSARYPFVKVMNEVSRFQL